MAQEHDQPLTTWASTWNDLWPVPQGEQNAALTDVQREHLNGLYALIAEDLRRLSATPKYRWLGDSHQDRVYALFERLVSGLLGRRYPLPCDNERVRRLLLRIASNRSIDLFREEERRGRGQVELTEANLPVVAARSPEDEVAADLDDLQVVEAILAYWSDLPWPDGEIMRLRYNLHRQGGELRRLVREDGDGRQRPFRSIAAHLGPPHKPDTVEKIHKRILERTREHLRQLGLLGDEGDNAHG